MMHLFNLWKYKYDMLHFSNLMFSVQHYAFLALTWKSDWICLGILFHIVHNPGSATEENQCGWSIDLFAECKCS